VNPPPPIISNAVSNNSCLSAHTSIQLASTIDCIWNLQNQAAHSGHGFNLLVIIQQLEARILEHIHSLEDTIPLVENTSHNILRWKAPKLGTIKLNVDAAYPKIEQ
jgi:hypothetical protein